MTVAQTVAAFIESEGHRVECSLVDGSAELSEVVFRTRGQMFSIAVSELEPQRYSVSTAYEVPELVGDRAHMLEVLADVESDSAARFILAQDDTLFVATMEYQTSGVDDFLSRFWTLVGRLREAGTTAIEAMVDRSESKAAADKFIRQFMKGER